MLRIGIAGICALLLVGGCASHSHRLDPAGSSLLRGEFLHGSENRMVVESADRRYVADGFEVRRETHLAELQRRYQGRDPKHWSRIFAGLDTDHETYSAEPLLKAQDGAELACRLAWSAGQQPGGTCLDATGRKHDLRFN